MNRKHIARIVGMGTAIPERVLSNSDLEKIVDTSDEWIVTRSGIKERRMARDEDFASTLGAEAAKHALAACDRSPLDIDVIIVVTSTPDYVMPSTANLVQDQLGAYDAASFDLLAACSGYIYGLSVARAYIESGMYKNVLLVAAEKMSSIIDWEDRSTCVLFGDGAAACVISGEGTGLSLGHFSIGSDGSLADLLLIPAGGARERTSEKSVKERKHFLKMRGRELFRHAVRRMTANALECLEDQGIAKDQVKWVVPHQANIRIIHAVAKMMGIPKEKFYLTLQKYGNTSASSVGIALKELYESQNFEEGDHILLTAFGAGLTWGSGILTRMGKEGLVE